MILKRIPAETRGIELDSSDTNQCIVGDHRDCGNEYSDCITVLDFVEELKKKLSTLKTEFAPWDYLGHSRSLNTIYVRILSLPEF